MKKISFYAVLAVATLASVSCSSDDVLVQSPSVNQPIEFGAYTGRSAALAPTRAHSVESTETLAADGGFGVFAYYTNDVDYSQDATPNFMYNQQVTSDDNGVNWGYSPLKYWPNDRTDRLTFFAYAPYANHSTDGDNFAFTTSTTTGDPKVTFTVNNDVKKQQDLLWSNSETDNIIKNTTDGVSVTYKTLFTFQHALSRIGFTVKAITDEVDAGDPAKKLDAATTIVLREVRLTSGTVDGNTAPTGTPFYTTGTLNLNNRTNVALWSSQDGGQYFTLNNDDFEAQSGVQYDGEGYVLHNENTIEANKLNTNDSYIMIIPQNFVGTGFNVYVEYDVITVDSNLHAGKTIVTNHISTPVKINFESGKAYLLNLQLGMTSVKVAASVANWENANNTYVDLPQNQN